MLACACGDEASEQLGPRPDGCSEPGMVEIAPEAERGHVEIGTQVDYNTEPPCIGPHYGQWAAWGVYDELPPETWVHNLEHGGIALLYDCEDPGVSDCELLKADLEAWARSVPADDGGPFRWIVTRRRGMGTPMAATAWGAIYRNGCVNPTELDTFKADHYRMAPEDVATPGSVHQ